MGNQDVLQILFEQVLVLLLLPWKNTIVGTSQEEAVAWEDWAHPTFFSIKIRDRV